VLLPSHGPWNCTGSPSFAATAGRPWFSGRHDAASFAGRLFVRAGIEVAAKWLSRDRYANLPPRWARAGTPPEKPTFIS